MGFSLPPLSGAVPASSITVGTTAITGGTNTRVLFDDGGFIGESAGLTYTKASGLLASTLMAIGGATIGTNALAVTGTAAISGTLTGNGVNSNADFRINSIGRWGGIADGVMAFQNTGGTQGVAFDISTSVWKFRNVANNADAAITAGAATFSGALKLNNARAAGVLVQGGSVTMLDSTGATITVLTT